MNPINMGELGEIGWYLKLELMQDKSRFGGNVSSQRKDKERIKQPLFQFRYDGKTGKYVREIKEHAGIDNALKDPNFLNGFFNDPNVMMDFEEKISPMKVAEAEDPKSTADGGTLTTDSGIEAEDKPSDVSKDVSRDINASQIEDLFDRRRKWGKGIAIYRLVDGKFQPKELDEEIKKQ
jgi:hypothetical protein